MFVDVETTKAGAATQWVAESGAADLFVLPGPTPADVARQYAELTGPTAMPQMFAIGYHQCRWAGRRLEAVGGGWKLNLRGRVCWQHWSSRSKPLSRADSANPTQQPTPQKVELQGRGRRQGGRRRL
jgi:hypothetical protein